MSGPYELDDRAAAALWMLALERDPGVEHIGALYADGERIARTATVSSGQNGKVKGGLTVPTGSLRGLFHNHPTRGGRLEMTGELFSKDDRAQAAQLDVPSYISTPKGHVRKYDPTRGETSDVLAAFPWDEFKSHLMRTLLDRAPDDPRGLMK